MNKQLVTCPRCGGEPNYTFRSCYLCDGGYAVPEDIAIAYRLLAAGGSYVTEEQIDELRKSVLGWANAD